MIELPVCRWRGAGFGVDMHACRSPKIMAPKGVPGSLCRQCALCDHAPAPAAPKPASTHCPYLWRRVREQDGKVKTRWCVTG